MSEGKNLSLQRYSSLKGLPSRRKQRENDREHVAEKLQRRLPKFNQFSQNVVFGMDRNDWIDHCCFRRSRDTREDYNVAQESLAPTNGVQRSHLREEHSALLHLPLVRSMESSRSRWRVCPAPVV
jgi:hypothetical protein